MKRKQISLRPLVRAIRRRAPSAAAVARQRALDRWENEGGEIPKGAEPPQASRRGLNTPGDLSCATSSATPDLQISPPPPHWVPTAEQREWIGVL